MTQKFDFQEKIRLIKERIEIPAYAQACGFEVRRRGRGFTLKEHDSIQISQDGKRFYRNKNGVYGDVINFVEEIEGTSKKEAIKKLWEIAYGPEIKTFKKIETETHEKSESSNKQPTELELPPRDPHPKNVFAYLLTTRGLHSDVVGYMIKRKQLYQDEKKNCVFVAYDNQNKPCYAMLRGTNPAKRFFCELPGCDYNHCFLIPSVSPGSKILVITESVIDAMSVMSLFAKKGYNFKDMNFLALCGVGKTAAIKTTLMEHPEITKIKLGYDNDEAGILCAGKSRKLIRQIDKDKYEIENLLPPADSGCKDWNEYLCKKNPIAQTLRAESPPQKQTELER